MARRGGKATKTGKRKAHAAEEDEAPVETMSRAPPISIANADLSAHPSDTTFAALGLGTWLVKQCASLKLAAPTPVQANCIPQILKGFFMAGMSSFDHSVAGVDCIACSKTGSGKTAAFALPILQLLSKDPYGIFAVILTPTRWAYSPCSLPFNRLSLRELAFQIADQFRAFGGPIGLKEAVIVGGLGQFICSSMSVSPPQGLSSSLCSCKTDPMSLLPHPDALPSTSTQVPTPFICKSMFVSCISPYLTATRVRFLVLDEADRLMTNESIQEDMGG
jgi:superfamily II DNA/RNA helicase